MRDRKTPALKGPFIRRLICPNCANLFEVRQETPFTKAQMLATHEVPCPKCSGPEGPGVTRMRVQPEHDDNRGAGQLPVERDVAVLRVVESVCRSCGQSAPGYELVEEILEMDSGCACSPGDKTPHKIKLRRRA